MGRRPGSLIRVEAQFFIEQVVSGRMTIDEARADIGIDDRTLAIWRQHLEWETWPRAMFTASIRLRRRISEKFEQLLAERVRETCKELSEAAETVEQEQPVAEVLTMVSQEEANGTNPVHNLSTPA